MSILRLAAAVLLAQLVCAQGWAFPIAPYYPLTDGYTWTYRVDGQDGYSRSILPGTADVNGVAVKVARSMPSGDLSYFTNDASGVRGHGLQQSLYVKDVGLTTGRVVLNPPLVHAAADANLGVAVSSFGSATITIDGLGTFAGTYSSNATPAAFESVTVSAGTFNALRIHATVTSTFTNVLGQTITSNETVDTWLAENVGVIKETSTEDAVIRTVELTGLNFLPALTFSSLSATWGSQPATGAPGNLYMGPMVANNSPFTVHLSAVVSGEFALQSGQDCTVLAPGQYCFLQVDFRPSSPGDKSGTLTVTSDAIGSPFVFPLAGTGSPVGAPTFAPSSLDFGNQDRGVLSAAKSVTLTNAGSGPLALDYIATTGQYYQTNNCGSGLAVSASCQINVTFKPFGAGVVTGDLIVDTPFQRLFVRLSGNGIGAAPPASVTPGGDLTFGAVQVGTPSAVQSFMLNNQGGSHLNVFSIGPGPGMSLGDFAFASACVGVLPAGASCAINVTFTPTATGERYGYLFIETDGYPSGTFLKPMVGTGVSGAVDTRPDAAAFAPKRGVPFNTRIASDPLTVTGIDAAAPITVTGGSYRMNGGFFLDTGGTVLPGQSVTAYVYAAARPAAAREVTLTIGGAPFVFRVFTAGSIGADFDGDGRADLLWRNTATGENYIYPLNGTAILAGEGYVRTVADANWKVAGIGDFDGDGRSDILWRNSSTGENYLYMMNGTTIANEGYIRTVADQNWQVAGVGDFDGDGKDDILWRNTATGENYVYLMNGTAIVNEGYTRTVANQNWKVAGIGDFDGDGRSDIVWRNSATGENYIYLMNGASIAGEGYLRTVADQGWKIAGVGDLNGDGKADIVWRHATSGENYVYPMDGITIMASEGYLRTVADAAWQIAAIGDYDGDGKSDLLWRNATTGENYLYPMDGTAIKPGEGYLRTVANPNWSARGK